MDAMIFDFDGVVVDSEPVHMRGFQEVLARQGVPLSDEEYYSRYLGYDDHDCFAIVGRDKGVAFSEEQIAAMTAEKTQLIQQTFRERIEPLPGARELIRSAHEAGIPLAICSGALRDEIALAARTVGVLDCFELIVSAEDVRAGKPDPEGYVLARQRLTDGTDRRIRAPHTLVVEDSPAGIASARAAGMHVLAVGTSYPPEALADADRIVHRLTEADLDLCRALTRED